MKKIYYYTLIAIAAILPFLSEGQCITPQGGDTCSSAGTFTYYGNKLLKYSWDSVKVWNNARITFGDSSGVSPVPYTFMEVYTKSTKDVELRAQGWNMPLSKYNLDNYTYGVQTGNEHIYYLGNNGITIWVIGDSCNNVTDTMYLYFRKLCSYTNDVNLNGSGEWLANVYKWTIESGSGPYKEYLGRTSNQASNFTNDIGSAAPTLLNSCTICPSGTSTDSFTVEYRMDSVFPRGFYKIICNTQEDLTLACTGGSYVMNYWDNGSSIPVKRKTSLLIPLVTGSQPYLPGILSNGVWKYALKNDTGDFKADISFCKMDGDFTWGVNKWNAYVFDNKNNSYTDGIAYQGTFSTDSPTFSNNWGTGQPTVNAQSCGITMDNDSFYTTYLMKRTYTQGRYKVRVRSEDVANIYLANKNGYAQYYMVNTNPYSGITIDYTSPYMNFSGDTFFVMYHYKTTVGNSRVSFVSCREPKDPGLVHATRDTACIGDQVTLTVNTADGTETQWYKKSCAGTGGLYIGSGASITVTVDTSTTFYVRNRNLAYAAGDTTNKIDLFSANCSSKTIIAVPYPSAPSAPSVQSACSSGSYVFTFSGVNTGANGNQVEWATNASFTNSHIIASGGTIYDTVANGHIDTIRLRSKRSDGCCVSSAVTTTATNYANPAPPTAPSSQSVCSDTAYTFIFDSIQVGAGGDSIQWALNSAFMGSYVIGPLGSIAITVNSGIKDTIWLRSKTTLTGCISSTVFTIAVTNPYPTIPTPPTPQSVCSDTAVIFLFDSILSGSGGDKTQWSYENDFSEYTSVNNYGSFSPLVYIGATDTFWLRSYSSSTGCYGNAVMTSARVKQKPISPSGIPPQAVLSDTPYLFTIPIEESYSANQTEWSLDSLFSISVLHSAPDTIKVLVHQNSDTIIWVRGIDTVSGCVSDVSSTIVAVETNNYNNASFDTSIVVCAGSADTIYFLSDSLVRYDLRSEDFLITSSIGDGNVIGLCTGVIDSSMVLNLWAVSTSDSIIITKVLMLSVSALDSVIFIEGDTLVYANDTTLCYLAGANNGHKTVYHVTSGNAIIDSLTGCMISISDTAFTIQATVYGAKSCSTINANLLVKVSNIPPPSIPENKEVVVDTERVISVVLDSLVTGSGGDRIEWSPNQDFRNSHIVTSPASIIIDLEVGADTLLYVRSRESRTGIVSPHRILKAGVSQKLLSAGLLDKSKWDKDINYSNEFDYNGGQFKLPASLPSFTNKWALNYCWGAGTCDPACCENHFNTWPGYTSANHEYMNKGNDGSEGEVSFANGIMTLTATPLAATMNNPCGVNPCAGAQTDFTYKSGMIVSRSTFNLSQPGMFEIRCKLSGSDTWPAFWLLGNETEIDVFDNPMEGTYTRSKSWFYDRLLPGSPNCGGEFYKQTACNLKEEWHTYNYTFTGTELVFFIDGKETMSKYLTTNNFPQVMSPAARVMINLSIPDWNNSGSTYTLPVDYFRYYTRKSTNVNPTLCLHNYSNIYNQPMTLESPNNSVNYYNNKPVKMFCNNGRTSTDIPYTKLSFEPSISSTKIYYRDFYHMCRNAYTDNQTCSQVWHDDRWYDYYLANNGYWVTDVEGDVTADGTGRVYYRSVQNNRLKYFIWMNNTWYNFSTTAYNCIGPICATNFGRIFYRGANNNIYKWKSTSYNTGYSTQETNSNSVAGGLVIASSGLVMFYRDFQNKLRQLYLSGGSFHELLVVNQAIVTDYIAIDEHNSIVYFIGTDNNIHSYRYNTTTVNNSPDALKNLGFENCAGNAKADLALSSDGHFIYYRSDDSKLWYYYNDLEGGSILSGRWNRTMLASNLIGGPILADNNSRGGRVFYRDKSSNAGILGKLCKIDWVFADDPILCPGGTGNAGYYNFYKTDESDSATSTSSRAIDSLQLEVYPNPSKSIYTFSLNGISKNENDHYSISIGDVSGAEILTCNKHCFESGTFIWNAERIGAGVYFYEIRHGEKFVRGKLVKL